MKEQVQPHILKRFELLRKIGSGAYGHVWKVRERHSGQILALKKIFDAFQHATDAQRTYRQILFLQKLNHENIIKLHNVTKAENDKDIYLVFEYMEIDLHRVILENILKDKHKKYIVYQIAKAIKYLHSADLIHRDLKPSNVLINSECLVKLCDFGLVRSLAADPDGQPCIMTEYVATRWYRAPEILLGSTCYSKCTDIWSLGCLMAEMFTGKPLFSGTSTLNQIERVLTWTGFPNAADIQSLNSDIGETMLDNLRNVKILRKEWFPDLEENAKDLLSKILLFNPNKRLTIQQVLEHPYLQEFHDPANEKVCSSRIVLDISDNRRLSVKEYRMLIYNKIAPRNRQDRRSSSKDLARADIRCDLGRGSRSKRKFARSITKPEEEESLVRTYAAKTVFLQNARKAPFSVTPGKQTKGYISSHMKFLPDRYYRGDLFSRTKYFTEVKEQSSFHETKSRTKIQSSHSKKNSLKPPSKEMSFSREKPGNMEEQPRRKSLSTNLGQPKDIHLLLKHYLNKSKAL